jgi:hypothetical protein
MVLEQFDKSVVNFSLNQSRFFLVVKGLDYLNRKGNSK